MARCTSSSGPTRSLQFGVNKQWIEIIGSRYHIGVDGLSLPLLILSMFIVVLCIIYSWDHFPEPHNPKAFLILILVLETGMNGTFSAEDLIANLEAHKGTERWMGDPEALHNA